MMRKTFFVLALSLVTLITSAQIGVGQWKIHPYFIGGDVTNCVDAGHHVYYLSKGSLFCYDKSKHSNLPIDATNVLNDENINQIYYDYIVGDLFITYDNCNIDIIKSDGSLVNVSAIKDVVLPKAKVINDISFGKGRAYVATSFGYIVIDETNFSVSEVRNYDLNVSSVSVVGNYKIMCLGGKFYYCGADEQVEQARWHEQADNPVGNGSIVPINNTNFFLLTSTALYRVSMSADGEGKLTFTTTKMPDEIPSTVQRTPSGFVASNYYYTVDGNYGEKIKVFRDYYYTFDADGGNPTKHSGEGAYSSHESGNWWALEPAGLVHIVGGVKDDPRKPNGISIRKRAYWTTYDPYQQRVLLCRTSENNVLDQWDGSTVTEINSYDGTQWRNITPQFDDTYGGNTWIVVSPNEPDTYFFCHRKIGGVKKVQNNTIVANYNTSNAPVGDRMMSIRFDSQGNLWMVQTSNPNADAVVISAQNQQLNEVNASHFVTNNLGGKCYAGTSGSKRTSFDIGAGDTKVFSLGNYNDPLIIWNNNDDLSVKQYKIFNSFNDQDNKPFSTYGWTYIKADNERRIWVGTVSGIISFDPQEAFNTDFRITRNKVTINEGAQVNEVLLEGTQVNCIDVDEFNRKWIGTNTNGVFLVSADGSEIIKHFDNTNSPLPTDQIYSVCCNRATNSVVIVTANGVVEYFNDMTPSEADYNNVYAYPNPVQSTFTGYVTIKGLMENSNVVITDAAGNTVATTTSIGGVAIWDVCNEQGVPVKTGTYKVYASQGQITGREKPVTKIAVIR
ncbi:MAG: hypothetical protein IJK68_06115 [Muribaculaceae bacterium]|nr:hypothetical protein [Muribaculaceae bacterium]